MLTGGSLAAPFSVEVQNRRLDLGLRRRGRQLTDLGADVPVSGRRHSRGEPVTYGQVGTVSAYPRRAECRIEISTVVVRHPVWSKTVSTKAWPAKGLWR